MRSTLSLLLVAAALVSRCPTQARVAQNLPSIWLPSPSEPQIQRPGPPRRKGLVSKLKSLLSGRQAANDEDTVCVLDNRYALALNNISKPEVDVFCNIWLGSPGLTSTVSYTPYTTTTETVTTQYITKVSSFVTPYVSTVTKYLPPIHKRDAAPVAAPDSRLEDHVAYLYVRKAVAAVADPNDAQFNQSLSAACSCRDIPQTVVGTTTVTAPLKIITEHAEVKRKVQLIQTIVQSSIVTTTVYGIGPTSIPSAVPGSATIGMPSSTSSTLTPTMPAFVCPPGGNETVSNIVNGRRSDYVAECNYSLFGNEVLATFYNYQDSNQCASACSKVNAGLLSFDCQGATFVSNTCTLFKTTSQGSAAAGYTSFLLLQLASSDNSTILYGNGTSPLLTANRTAGASETASVVSSIVGTDSAVITPPPETAGGSGLTQFSSVFSTGYTDSAGVYHWTAGWNGGYASSWWFSFATSWATIYETIVTISSGGNVVITGGASISGVVPITGGGGAGGVTILPTSTALVLTTGAAGSFETVISGFGTGFSNGGTGGVASPTESPIFVNGTTVVLTSVVSGATAMATSGATGEASGTGIGGAVTPSPSISFASWASIASGATQSYSSGATGWYSNGGTGGVNTPPPFVNTTGSSWPSTVTFQSIISGGTVLVSTGGTAGSSAGGVGGQVPPTTSGLYAPTSQWPSGTPIANTSVVSGATSFSTGFMTGGISMGDTGGAIPPVTSLPGPFSNSSALPETASLSTFTSIFSTQIISIVSGVNGAVSNGGTGGQAIPTSAPFANGTGSSSIPYTGAPRSGTYAFSLTSSAISGFSAGVSAGGTYGAGTPSVSIPFPLSTGSSGGLPTSQSESDSPRSGTYSNPLGTAATPNYPSSNGPFSPPLYPTASTTIPMMPSGSGAPRSGTYSLPRGTPASSGPLGTAPFPSLSTPLSLSEDIRITTFSAPLGTSVTPSVPLGTGSVPSPVSLSSSGDWRSGTYSIPLGTSPVASGPLGTAPLNSSGAPRSGTYSTYPPFPMTSAPSNGSSVPHSSLIPGTGVDSSVSVALSTGASSVPISSGLRSGTYSLGMTGTPGAVTSSLPVTYPPFPSGTGPSLCPCNSISTTTVVSTVYVTDCASCAPTGFFPLPSGPIYHPLGPVPLQTGTPIQRRSEGVKANQAQLSASCANSHSILTNIWETNRTSTAIDFANDRIESRDPGAEITLVQPLTLCPGAAYELSLSARQDRQLGECSLVASLGGKELLSAQPGTRFQTLVARYPACSDADDCSLDLWLRVNCAGHTDAKGINGLDLGEMYVRKIESSPEELRKI